jgi:acetyl esterase/lipase
VADPRDVLTRRAPEPTMTLRYGGRPDHVADVWLPSAGSRVAPAGGGAPLVVVIHGGFWRSEYGREIAGPMSAALRDEGYVVAAVEYRRTGGAGGWPMTCDDVAAACGALPDLIATAAPTELGAGALGPVVLVGHSAGGHLALWAAARHVLPPESPWHRPSPPPVRGVVALAPIADFTSAIRLGVCSGAVVDLLGGPEHLTARLPDADPAALLPTGIATTIVHGTTDNVVPPQVSRAFARAAAVAGEEVVAAWLPGTGHFPLIDPSTAACAAVVDEITQLAW